MALSRRPCRITRRVHQALLCGDEDVQQATARDWRCGGLHRAVQAGPGVGSLKLCASPEADGQGDQCLGDRAKWSGLHQIEHCHRFSFSMTAADVTGQSLRDVRVFMAGVVRIPAPDLAGTTRCAAAIVASGWAAVPGFASFPAGERCRLKPDSSAACRNPANSHGNAIASSLQRHGRFTQDPGPKRLIRDVVFMATFTCIVCCLVCYITSRQENRRFTQRGAAAAE